MINWQLPVVDLHRHLDGNFRPQTILDFARQYNVTLPATTLAELIPHVQVTKNEPNLLAFLSKLDWGVSTLGSLDACYRLAYENAEDAKNAGLDYAELRFSPYYMAHSHGLNPADVVAAVVQGIADGQRDFGVPLNLIGIISRTYGKEIALKELDAILTHKDKLVAVDLAGDEGNYPGEWFVEHFAKVRDAGLAITVHAGEAVGAHSVWQAINELGASRIGHGVNAINDDKLVAHLAKQHIGLEICLTSNLQTNTIPDLSKHPIKAFLAAGVPVNLNTDDPGISAIEIENEYEVANRDVAMTPSEISQTQRNGVAMAFLSDADKNALLTKAAQRGA